MSKKHNPANPIVQCVGAKGFARATILTNSWHLTAEQVREAINHRGAETIAAYITSAAQFMVDHLGDEQPRAAIPMMLGLAAINGLDVSIVLNIPDTLDEITAEMKKRNQSARGDNTKGAK